MDKKIDEALQDYHADTVIIKGANAFDQDGHVGVITSGFNGGTVPNFIGYMTSKGLKWLCPVGYEKMVPSVPAASRALGGASHIDISMGADPGLYCLSSADIVTEVEAIKAMFHCDAKVVCAGGIGLSLPNDSGFWAISRFFHLNEVDTIRGWTLGGFVAGVSILIFACVLSLFQGFLPGLI